MNFSHDLRVVFFFRRGRVGGVTIVGYFCLLLSDLRIFLIIICRNNNIANCVLFIKYDSMIIHMMLNSRPDNTSRGIIGV